MTHPRVGGRVFGLGFLVAVGLTGCAAVGDYPYMTEGQPHAEAVVAAVAREWKADALLKNADPSMLRTPIRACWRPPRNQRSRN